MWQDVKAVYHDTWRAALLLPIAFLIPALVEFVQHVVEEGEGGVVGVVEPRKHAPVAHLAGVRRRGSQLRIGDDRRQGVPGSLDLRHHGDQHRPPPPAFGQPAKHEGPRRTHHQRQHRGIGDRLHIGAETLRDRLETDHQQREIERVERPAKIGRPDRSPLMLGKAAPFGKQAGLCHWFPLKSAQFGGMKAWAIAWNSPRASARAL